MSDFDTDQLLTDWDDVLTRAGAVTATTGGVTFSAVWAQQSDLLTDMEEQLRGEVRFTVATTYTELATLPTVRQTLVRSGVTYVVEAVRSDAELACIEFDCKKVI
jgi:uncharacterized protein (AIM24 family)